MNDTLKSALLITGGIAAGFITGLLTAPKSGKETRKDIKDSIDKLQSKIEGMSGEAKAHIEDKINQLKESLKGAEA